MIVYTALIENEMDKLTFTNIYNSYRKQMIAVATGILKNQKDAEDAVQSAFIGIAQTFNSVPKDDPKKMRAYVLIAARNAAINMLPKKKQQDNLVDISEKVIPANDDLFQRVVMADDYELILRVMRQLPTIYRDVLLMVYVEELTVNEAAKALNRASGTVRQQLNRGKKLLIELCKKEGMCYDNV